MHGRGRHPYSWLLVVSWTAFRERPADSAPTVRFTLAAPAGTKGGFWRSSASANEMPAVSPDGRHLAFVAASEKAARTFGYISLATGEARELPGTNLASGVFFWSPDSHYLAFFANRKLMRADLREPLSVRSPRLREGEGESWNRDGVIVFAPTGSDGLYQINARAGACVR